MILAMLWACFITPDEHRAHLALGGEDAIRCGALSACDGSCVDLDSDVDNCGECGRACPKECPSAWGPDNTCLDACVDGVCWGFSQCFDSEEFSNCDAACASIGSECSHACGLSGGELARGCAVNNVGNLSCSEVVDYDPAENTWNSLVCCCRLD